MTIEKLPVSQLLPADYNPRKDLKPGDAEYEALKRSIEQFGYLLRLERICAYPNRETT